MPRTGSCWVILVLVAGCAPPVSLPQSDPASEATEAASDGITPAAGTTSAAQSPQPLAFQELLPLIQANSTPGKTVPVENFYGIWVTDRGNTRTWMRIENPLLHVVGVDKVTNGSWVLNGHYAAAHDGTIYGVMTELDQANAQPERAVALLENDERVLKGRQPEKRLMPFSCRFETLPGKGSDPGPGLVVSDFHGTCFEKDRERLLHGQYQRTSLARPSYALPAQPLGIWECEPSGWRIRLTLVLQPGRFEYRLYDYMTGRRVHISGECSPAPGDVLFGVITSIRQADLNKELSGGRIPPQAFCLRHAWGPGTLEIRGIRSLSLAESTHHLLAGQYHPPRPSGAGGGNRRVRGP